MRPVLCCAVAILIVLFGAATAVGEQAWTVDVAIAPDMVDVKLGEAFDIAVTTTNTTEAASPPLVAHIDITDPTRSSSVDPEDWTATLSTDLGILGPGESRTVDWTLQPISSGSFVVYAVVLSPGDASTSVSTATLVTVASSRPLNPEGVLPAVIIMPIVVGGLLSLVLRRSRHR